MAKKTEKKRTIWMVRVNRGLAGWEDFKAFTNPEEADNWLCDFVRKNGYWMSDFNIVRREA